VERISMANVTWGAVIMGTLFTLVGIGFLVSPKFGAFTIKADGRGVIWGRLLGEKWTPIVVRFIFSAIAIAVGLMTIYSGIYGYD
jgi:hypothetical protein